METREENLKKINEELEQLNDDELDKVVGGALTLRGIVEVADDGSTIIKNLAGTEIVYPKN